MNKYTVILLLPDWARDEFGEVRTMCIEARNPKQALKKSFSETAEVIGLKHVSDETPDSVLLPVAIYEGFLNNLWEGN